MDSWIMVIVTTIYMITTIFICVFNHRSAKSAKEQVDQMKEQYQNDLRIRMMPFFSVQLISRPKQIHGTFLFTFDYEEKHEHKGTQFYFQFSNAGHDIAKNVRCKLIPEVRPDRQYEVFSLPAGQSRNVLIHIECATDIPDGTHVEDLQIQVHYEDLFGSSYSQECHIIILRNCGNVCLETYYISAPQLLLAVSFPISN